jgi:hypothetical protein
MDAAEAARRKDVDPGEVGQVRCCGDRRCATTGSCNEAAKIPNTCLDHVISHGNLFMLILIKADVDDTFQDRNGGRDGSTRSDDVLDGLCHPQIHWPGEPVTDDRGFQGDDGTSAGSGLRHLRQEDEPLFGLRHSCTVSASRLLSICMAKRTWQDVCMSEVLVAEQLRADIERTGYYPDLVADALHTALGGEPLVSYMLHHEATFDRDQLRRHMTVLALTPTRLIVGHTDEHAPDEANPVALATTSTEAVRLERVDSVVVTRVVSDPARHRPGGPAAEVVLTIGWGAVSRLDLEPASCGDPSCDGDHGYTGTATNDDFSVRISAVADGTDVIERALEFAARLSQATATSLR